MIGRILKARYEITEKIGEGNLFTVYKCEDKINNRTLAAKILQPHYASNTMFAQRLLAEAQAMVGISHPGLVEVYDCGEEEAGEYFVIVEYIRGVDLKERIRRSAPFTLSTAVDVGIAICSTLDFAHYRGFVHGDLRPGNIMVTTEGQIKIADFWVSSAIAAMPAIREKTLMSTVHYTAPEVAGGKPAQPVSDVYSLGIIMFELLTGTVPFDGETAVAIALKHAREPIPAMRSLNAAVPKNVEAIIVRALQKDPGERFRSAKSMLSELSSARDALHLSKPLVWSQVTEDKPVAPVVEKGEEPDEWEEAEPVYLKAGWKLAQVVFILAILLVAASVVFFMTSPKDVVIPNLVGRTLDQAQMTAADQKFQLVIHSEQFNEQYAAGTIFYQDPDPGRAIKQGKVVKVWLSKGSQYATTPNVVKQMLEDARQRIQDAGLNVGEISQEYSQDIPAGNVVSQSPQSGTRLDRGQSINLIYSLGPKPEDVPITPPDPEQTSSTPRSFNLNFTVPSGPQDQSVQIRVEDDNGENVVYTDIKHPGDVIEQEVEGVGDKVTIKIYIDDKLIKEERKWR